MKAAFFKKRGEALVNLSAEEAAAGFAEQKRYWSAWIAKQKQH